MAQSSKAPPVGVAAGHAPSPKRGEAPPVARELTPDELSADTALVPAGARKPYDSLFGLVIDGRYRIDSVMGSGGMSQVYAGTYLKTSVKVAIKMIDLSISGDLSMQERSVNEARSMMQLQSNHVVRALDVGTLPSGQIYIVMEYLDGEDLGAILTREGALPWSRVADIGVQICNGLATAHRRGIIHRDIKPQNCFQVLVDDNPGHIKIIDFGVARDEARAGPTQQGFLIGTPEYSAPELLGGVKANPASDVYALGVTLYKLLTGLPPFRGATPMETLRKHVTAPLVPPTKAASHLEIPPVADEILGRALAKDPAKRYASAEEMSRALRSALGMQLSGLVVRPERPVTVPPRRPTDAPPSDAPATTLVAAPNVGDPGPPPRVSPALQTLSGQHRPVDRVRLLLRSMGLLIVSLAFVLGTKLVRPKAGPAELVDARQDEADEPDLQAAADPPPPISDEPAPEQPDGSVAAERPETPTSEQIAPAVDAIEAPPPIVAKEPPPTIPEPDSLDSPPEPQIDPAPPSVDPSVNVDPASPGQAPSQPELRFDYKEAKKNLDEQIRYLRGTCMTRAAVPLKRLKFRLDVRANGRANVKVFASDKAVRACVRDLLVFSFDASPNGGAFIYELTESGATLKKMPIDPEIVK